ncbi:MAG: ABC transporter substrate-binding protein, partial [Chloroflexota bacterium]
YSTGKADHIAGITTPDDYTIKFDMEYPNALFVYQCVLPFAPAILPEHILGSVKPADLEKHPFFHQNPVGFGPFKFVKFVADQYVEMDANPDYFLGKPKLDKFFFRIIAQLDTAMLAIQNGAVDVNAEQGPQMTKDIMEKFVANPKFGIYGVAAQVVDAYAFNFRKKYLADPRIHQAVLYALDRQKLIDTFDAGAGSIVNSPLIQPWFQKPEWNQMYPFDPQKAKDLLKAASWNSSTVVPISIIKLTSENDRAQVATEQQMLSDVGFQVKPIEMDVSVWVDKFYNTHDYDMVRVGFGTFPDPDAFLSFHFVLDSKDAMGFPDWAGKDFTNLVDQGKHGVDRAKRAAIYQQINEEYFLKDLPLAPLRRRSSRFVLNRRIAHPYFDRLTPATAVLGMKDGPQFIEEDDMEFHAEQIDVKPS